MSAQDENQELKKELTGLFHYIQRVRSEIAAIHHPAEEDHHFEKMGDQLDAIVEATEKATDTIMSTVESNEALLGEVRAGLGDDGLIAKIDEVSANNMGLFEACSFQDITGQRIGKVVEELKFMNDKLASMVDIWGPEALSKEPLLGKADDTPEGEVLEGPALEGKGVSQDDIDKLFD